jgi:Flp pilus assembly protein TadB
MMLPLIAALAVVSFVMLYLASRNRPATAQRLEEAMHSGGLVLPESALEEDLSRTIVRRLSQVLVRMVQGGLTQLTPVHWRDAARLKMQRSGRDSSLMMTGYLLCRVLMILTAVVAGGCALVQVEGPPMTRLSLLLVVMAVTLVLPEAILNAEIRRRQEEIRVALPDVTDLLAVSTEAGVGLDGALAIVVKRKPGPLSDEFRRLLLEIRLGADREEAWDNLVARVGVSELQSLVGSLHDAEQTGASLPMCRSAVPGTSTQPETQSSDSALRPSSPAGAILAAPVTFPESFAFAELATVPSGASVSKP